MVTQEQGEKAWGFFGKWDAILENAAEYYEYAKDRELYNLKGLILWQVNYTSIKLHKEKNTKHDVWSVKPQQMLGIVT